MANILYCMALGRCCSMDKDFGAEVIGLGVAGRSILTGALEIRWPGLNCIADQPYPPKHPEGQEGNQMSGAYQEVVGV